MVLSNCFVALKRNYDEVEPSLIIYDFLSFSPTLPCQYLSNTNLEGARCELKTVNGISSVFLLTGGIDAADRR